MKNSKLEQPLQPLVTNQRKVICFMENRLVVKLFNDSKLDIDDIEELVAGGQFSETDYAQFLQLLGFPMSKFQNSIMVNERDKFRSLKSKMPYEME